MKITYTITSKISKATGRVTYQAQVRGKEIENYSKTFPDEQDALEWIGLQKQVHNQVQKPAKAGLDLISGCMTDVMCLRGIGKGM